MGDQEGISYSKALPVDGRDKPGDPNERLYICPRYWDRQHQIPLSPENEEHPILKIPYDDVGKKKGWKNYIEGTLYNVEGLPASSFRSYNFD